MLIPVTTGLDPLTERTRKKLKMETRHSLQQPLHLIPLQLCKVRGSAGIYLTDHQIARLVRLEELPS